MSGKAIRETLGFVAVVVSMVFVGMEIRQNTIAARAAAYQGIGFQSANIWHGWSRDPAFSDLRNLASDTATWDEIDETGWTQLSAALTGSMRSWETLYLQVQEGLLPEDAMTRFGWGINFWPASFERLWPEVRTNLDDEFARYVEQQFGVTP